MMRTRTVSWEDPAELAERAYALPGLEFLRAIGSGELPPPPIGALLGFGGVEASEGRVVFRCQPGEHHYNPIGSVHGGLAATLLDSALGCAVHSTLPAGWGYVTLDLSVTFLRPLTAEAGEVVCEGKVQHRGRTVATAAGTVALADSGKVVAQGSATCLLRELAPAKAEAA
jgi:uncharacterized protein (TIGR00369 family)